MESEKNIKAGCRIFTIYFKNQEKQYDFGPFKGRSEEILKSIAHLGNTDCYYDSNSIEKLVKVFETISKVIEDKIKAKFIDK